MYFINLFQIALVALFALPAFGQVVVGQTTSYDGMTTTTEIHIDEVAMIRLAEDRTSHGTCVIAYTEGDIPPHKMEAIQLVERVCRRYNRSQEVAAKLSKEFGVTHYQALKISLESAFGWPGRYQRAPVDGLEFETRKIARKYVRAKKKAEKEAMKKRLIKQAFTHSTKEVTK